LTSDLAHRPSYTRAIQRAYQALKRGDRRLARRWAERAASLAPKQEEPWLIMAALASPRASLEYLKHALEANPESARARKGMHWAIQRYRVAPPQSSRQGTNIPIRSTWKRRTTFLSWAVVLLAITIGAAVWFGTPSFSSASNQNPNLIVLAQEWVGKATYTPTPTATFTPTPTFTLTPTPTDTPTITPSLTPTETSTPIPTATEISSTEESIAPKPKVNLPPGVEKGEIWIDVDLTNQYLQVYKGKNLLDGFVVSTGTWRTPTVTGQYQVYVKYVAADMAGPGYYLPSVPYVMYFYDGYGIHGTYWHNNFGTPMSHGCINLHTEDAEWVYNKSSVGTTVNIHY
jgi:lipoprotein-anchoring transpeptidase ErfK/SrfK